MTAGAQYGYLLVWVVVLGNVMAWLIQYLSAKLGIVTGRSLPETLGDRIRNRRRAALLAAGRARRDGDRHRRGHRRRGRAAICCSASRCLGRGHHRHGVDARCWLSSPGGARARSSSSSSDGRRSSRSASSRRVHRVRPTPAAVVGGLVPALRGHRLGAAGGIHPRRDDHAARDLRALRARPATGSARSPPGEPAAPAAARDAHGTSRSRCSSPAP